MDIIRFLKYQHEEVKNVLNEIIVQNDASESHSLLEQMSKMLRLHMQIEETIVYPAASRCFQGDRRKPSVLQSFEEHELARHCLSALESTPPTDEHFVARAKVLKGVLHEHIFEEESELFPSLATKLGQSGIDMLGDEVERQLSKLEAESAPRPATPAVAEPPTRKSRGARVARTRRPATKSRSAKVAQTRRQRATVRGAKGSRRQATASRSAKRH
jgi:iron-sulfur cluster repair protein YtfE (RIC family)